MPLVTTSFFRLASLRSRVEFTLLSTQAFRATCWVAKAGCGISESPSLTTIACFIWARTTLDHALGSASRIYHRNKSFQKKVHHRCGLAGDDRNTSYIRRLPATARFSESIPSTIGMRTMRSQMQRCSSVRPFRSPVLQKDGTRPPLAA
jgi:hypothetical protein